MENDINPPDQTNDGDVIRGNSRPPDDSDQEPSNGHNITDAVDAKVIDKDYHDENGHKNEWRPDNLEVYDNLKEFKTNDGATDISNTNSKSKDGGIIIKAMNLTVNDENDEMKKDTTFNADDHIQNTSFDSAGKISVTFEDDSVTKLNDIEDEHSAAEDNDGVKMREAKDIDADANKEQNTSGVEANDSKLSGKNLTNVGSSTICALPFCEPCTREGLDNQTQIFCETCNQYFCHNCTNNHNKLFSSKSHRVLEGDSLLNKTQAPVSSITETLAIKTEEMCPIHPDDKIEYFCAWDLQLCCKICVDIEHKKCKVSFIPEESKNIESSHELVNVLDRLTSVEKQLNSVNEVVEKKRTVTTKCHDSTLDVVRRFKNDMEMYLQRLVENAIRDEETIHTGNNENLQKVEAAVNEMFEDYRKSKECIEKNSSEGQKCQLYIAMKRADSLMGTMQKQLRELTNDYNVIHYVFAISQEFEQFMKSQFKLGAFMNLDFDSIKSTLDVTMSITGLSFTEVNSCTTVFTGIEYIGNEKLVLTGWSGNNIFLIDLHSSKIASRVLVSSVPYDVTSISETKVAVTIPGDKKVQFIAVQDDNLFLEEEIIVNDKCYGIANSGTSLVVTFPQKVMIIDHSGTVLKEINKGIGDVGLSSDPMYVAVDPEGLSIYLSDGSRHTITRLDLEGSPIGFYMNSSLVNPRGIVVDENGFVFVCGQKSSNVHCLTPDLMKGRVILGQEDDLIGPTCLSYAKALRKLYIGRQYPIDKKLKVFSLSKAFQPLMFTENDS